MKISSLSPSHVPKLSPLHRAAFGEAQAWDSKAIAEVLALHGTHGWVAEEQGEVRGFILVSILFEQAEILTLAVHPDYQRRGIAAALMQQAMVAATTLGATGFFLEVAVDNAPAIALYHALSFTETRRRAGYYPRADGQAVDAVVMEWTFEEQH